MIVVELLDGLGGEVVEVLVRALGVEPHHPFGGGQFDLVDVPPRALAADDLVLERSDGGLGQRVVQGIADRADRGIHTFIDEAVGEGHRGGDLTPCVGHAQSQECAGGSEMIQPDGKEKLPR